MGLPWVRLDSSFAGDPLVGGLSDRAFRLHVNVLCIIAGHRNADLFIHDGTAEREAKLLQRRLPGRLIDELVDAGVWIKLPDGGYMADGWNVSIGVPNDRRQAIDPAVRLSIYERDNYACVLCGSTEQLSIDHIVPFSAGGSDAVENLRTLCIPCNSRRGAARFDDESLRNRAENA